MRPRRTRERIECVRNMLHLKHNRCNWNYVIGLKAFLFGWLLLLCGADASHGSMHEAGSEPDDLHIFESDSFPATIDQQPTLANGHVGFTVFADTVYMTGLYNGHAGLSHRARIPNWANIRARPRTLAEDADQSAIYRLNTRIGTFEVEWRLGTAYRIEQRVYAHRHYTRAIVNEVRIVRDRFVGAVTVALQQNAGNRSTEDITFDRVARRLIIGADNQPVTSRCGYTNEPEFPRRRGRDRENHGSDDVSAAAADADDDDVDGGGGGGIGNHDISVADDANRRGSHRGTQQHRQRVCVLWNHVPEEITLAEDAQVTSARFVMTVDGRLSVAKREIMSVLSASVESVYDAHVSEWQGFWSTFDVAVEADAELSRVVYASIFAIVSSLPAINGSLLARPFGGLSPTGLPKGGDRLSDYEGHSMWDAEIWMLPAVLLMNPEWTETMLNYRFKRLAAARAFANETGMRGARFPWESAHSGRDVTQPCCPHVARDQLHISADVAFAVRQHWAATHDRRWLCARGHPLTAQIAAFWADRVRLNRSSGFNDIADVMGPDEDHDGVTNNAYTNVAVGLALYFADFSACMCRNNTPPMTADDALLVTGDDADDDETFSSVAAHLKLPFDPAYAYNPQFDGYRRGTIIKQADTVLIGYPLLYDYDGTATATTAALRNNLAYYESVMRPTGPAMTWTMHAINHLQLRPRDAHAKRRADVLFRRGYRAYVRGPFRVWNEVIAGEEGAQNFLTGAGGFLQSMFNGYAGLKVRLDGLHIDRPVLPAHVRRLSLTGIRYVGSKWRLVIGRRRTLLECVDLRAPFAIRFANGTEQNVSAAMPYDITGQAVIIRPTSTERCPLPTDLIGVPRAVAPEI